MPEQLVAETYFIVMMMVLILVICFAAVLIFFRQYRKEMRDRAARSAAKAKLSENPGPRPDVAGVE